MSDTTISQALRNIKKLKGQIAEHLDRASKSVSHYEKKPPAFDFARCMELADNAKVELAFLEASVAVANATTTARLGGKDVPLVLAIKTLQEMKGKIAWLRGLTVLANEENVEEETEMVLLKGDYHNVKTEKKYYCAFPEEKRAKLIETIQNDFDKLNDQVETINHRTVVKIGS